MRLFPARNVPATPVAPASSTATAPRAVPAQRVQIGELLVARGVVTERQVADALADTRHRVSGLGGEALESFRETHTRAFARDSPRMPVGRNMRTTSKRTKAITSFHSPPKIAAP